MPDNCGCDSTPLSNFSGQYFGTVPDNCISNECGGSLQNSKCIVYSGAPLTCSGINTNDTLELAFQKIDQQICAVTGNYSTYNYNCLDDSVLITTEGGFVSAITAYACALSSTVNTFIGMTYPANQTIINNRLTALEFPGITCTVAGVGSTDSLVSVLNKYCVKFGAINSSLDISGVNWSKCYSVTGTDVTE